MSRYALAAALGLPWLALAGGLVLLVVRRRRAPRAVGFAQPVVAALTLVTALEPVRLPPGARGPGGLHDPLYWSHTVVPLTAWAVLPVAAMIGRRRGGDDVG